MDRTLKPPELKIVPDANALYRAAADEFLGCSKEAIAANGGFCVALSGGNTPRGVYSLIAGNAKNSLPWDKVYIFFGDERHVPPNDRESNFRMANEALLSQVPIPGGNIFRIHAELAAETAAQQYEEQLRTFFRVPVGGWPRFDLIFLGLGDDGHTASLFPGSAALNETERLVVANRVAKFNGFRITFTYPLLNHAAEILFLVSGEAKSGILRDVLKPSGSMSYPAQLVRPTNGRLLWIADKAAAQLL